jgi:hypothetical protein
MKNFVLPMTELLIEISLTKITDIITFVIASLLPSNGCNAIV